MCNTREENAAEPENEEEGLKTVNITRSALIEKLIEYRSDDWDHHDTDEVLEYGRIGFIELSNEDLERIALDYMLEEDGVEVAYHITDADISKPAGKVNQSLITTLEALIGVAQWAMDHGGSKDGIEPMIAQAQAAIAQANQGSH